MTILEILVLLLIAGVCGAIGQALAGSSRGGCFLAIVVGFIGAFFGMWLSRSLGLPEPFYVTIDDTAFPVLWSIVGSALLVAVLSLLGRSRG